MDLDIGKLSEIAGSAMLAGFAAIEKPHPLVIAAGVLLTVRAVLKEMTVTISDQEASVFWGFIKVCKGKTKEATREKILKETNNQRKKYGLKPLSQDELLYSLKKLEELKTIESIARGDKSWRIVEHFKIS